MADSDVAMPDFFKWASELGISDAPTGKNFNSRCCLGYSLFLSNFQDAGGRGLAAARVLRKGELILQVPKHALMSLDSLTQDNSVLFHALQRYRHLSTTQVMVVYLLTEVAKKKDSRWYQYLQQLPRLYLLLASFSEFEAQALQIEDAVSYAKDIRKNVHSEWEQSQELMHEVGLKHPFTTFRSWLWSFSTVSSRTLHVPWDTAGCLCPVGDLFNYATPGVSKETTDNINYSSGDHKKMLTFKKYNDVNCVEDPMLNREFCFSNESSRDTECMVPNDRLTDAHYEEEGSAYCFYARETYQYGEQVLLCYGQYTNIEILEHYGFVLHNNPNEKTYIDLGGDLLNVAARHWKDNQLYLQWNGEPSFSLLAALRLYLAPPKLRKELGHRVFSGLPISLEHDKILTRWLKQKCADIISKFMTTVCEDESLLEIVDKCLAVNGKDLLQNILHEIDGAGHEEGFIILSSFPRWSKLSSGGRNHVIGQLITFSKMNVSPKHKYCGHLNKLPSASLNRWKLAIRWRLEYKMVLHRCLSYCNAQY